MSILNLLRRIYWSIYLAWHLPGQARYPFRSARRIARDRDRRVRRMVRYAYRWVPYYRETLDRLGLTPRDFRTFDDLRKLPLITVADLQADPERFRSRQFVAQELIALSSSGSTGRPHIVWHNLAAAYQNIGHARREEMQWARVLRGRRRRKLSITSAMNSATAVRAATRRNALWPRWVARSAPALAIEDGPAVWVAAINARRPDYLTAYGSWVSHLVAYVRQTGVPLHWPRLIRYVANMLPDAVRCYLAEQGVQVFSGYQAIEAFKMGFECAQHNGYHTNDDLYPLRIVDAQGNDCPPGVTGEIVLSNLVNRGTVLLNYRMGDLAARLAEPCPCGRHLGRISYVQGRTNDALYDVNGAAVSQLVLTAPISATPGVLEWQVRQTALDRLVIQLVTAPDCDRAATTERLCAAARARLGATVQVEVRFVDEIALTPAGKLRFIINEVAPL